MPYKPTTPDLGKEALTDLHLKVLEPVLIEMAEIIDLLLKDRVPYTKILQPPGGA